MSGRGKKRGLPANDEAGAGEGLGEKAAGFTEFGRFIDEGQLEELRFAAKALGCCANMLDGDGEPPRRADIEAIFRVFAERLEDILADEMPVIQFAHGANGEY